MPKLSLPLLLDDVYFGIQTADEPRMAPGGELLAHVVLQLDRAADARLSRIVVLARDGGDWTQTAGFGGSAPRWSPTGTTLAFVDDRHADGAGLFLWRPGDERLERLVDVAGVVDLAWRPDGQAIALVLAAGDPDPGDPIVVRDVPIHTNGRQLGAGPDQLFLVDVPGGGLRRLADTEYNVSAPAWRPTGDGTIAFCGGHHAHLPSHVYLLDTEAGDEPRSVTPAEGEAEHVTWTPDGARLVVSGKRVARSVGQRELFVCDPEEGELRRIAADVDREVDVSQYPLWHGSVAVVDSDGEHVLWTAYDCAEVSLFRSPLDGGPTKRLLGEPFEAIGVTTVAGEEIVTVVSDPTTAGEVELLGRDGARRRLTNVAGGLLDGLVEPEYRTFTAPDGLEVHGVLLRGAERSAPGPLLVNIHGGPHYAYVPAINEQDLHNWEFAARGWNVLMLNPRGSFGRGQDFFRGVLNGWCELDMGDFMSAIDALVEEGVADPDRLCVTGYSYGGIMTNYLLAHTDRFRAAVSGASFCDFSDMYGTADVGVGLVVNELGGRPFERQELYDRISPIRVADRITTPVLFMQGSDDRTTPIHSAEKLYTTLRDLGRETELVVYPGVHHVYATWPVSLRLDYDRRLVDWMTRYGLGEPSG
ncbi:MAG TPA: S9 family peptidase [Conexibacter sp.]|nr:S9 family peptidase [Conexibacter sp.]